MEPAREHKQLEVLTALDQAKTQWYHFTAIVIAGMGFFTDAYDLFCIGVVTKLLGRIYYPQDDNSNSTSKPGQLPIGVNASVIGTALVGTLAGQLFFGYMGDLFGRKRVYGITLTMMVMFSIASGLSFGQSPEGVMATLCFFRFWLGFGIGGDYPLSATIMSEYANTKTRGAFIAAVFAMQGFGILTAGAVGVILAKLFDNGAPAWADNPKESLASHADYLWRAILMLGAVPAAATYYYRMKMPETARYTALVLGDAKKAAQDMTKVLDVPEEAFTEKSNVSASAGELTESYGLLSKEFLRRHGLHLLGTTTTWFVLDVAFYSQNLYQTQIFGNVGWIPKARQMNAIDELYRGARAQCLLALFSTVPGYWVTVLLVDRIGRFIIQLQGFVFMTIFMLAIAIRYDVLISGSKEHIYVFLVLYALTFFFSNFGPNATTFIVPAEIFPARLRATCHGISAAAGKAGAIVGAFGFLYASQNKDPSKSSPYPPGIGPRNALFTLAVLNAFGAAFTFLVPESNNRSLEDLSGENDFTKASLDKDETGLKYDPASKLDPAPKSFDAGYDVQV